MNNEEKKGLNKFHFSTEIDRADLENTKTIRIDPEVLKEEMRKLDAKKNPNGRKSRSSSNRRNNSRNASVGRRSNPRRQNRSRRGNYKESRDYAPNEEETNVEDKIDMSIPEDVVEETTPDTLPPKKVVEDDIPLLDDEEKWQSQNTSSNETEDSNVSPEFEEKYDEDYAKDEMPTACNKTISISEEDIVPVTDTNLDEEETKEEEEAVEEKIPTVMETTPVPIVEEDKSSLEKQIMNYRNPSSAVEVPVVEEPVKQESKESEIVDHPLDDIGIKLEKKVMEFRSPVTSAPTMKIIGRKPVTVIPASITDQIYRKEKETNPVTTPVTKPVTEPETEPMTVPASIAETNPAAEPLVIPKGFVKQYPGNDDEKFQDTLLEGTLVRDKILVHNDTEDKVIEEVKAAMAHRDFDDSNDEKSSEEASNDVVVEHSINRFYLGFKARVALLIIGILVLFGTACFVIIESLKGNTVRKINFMENSTIHYEVCSKNKDKECVKEGATYSSSESSKINLDYHYEANFAEKINHDISYYVVVVNRISDANDTDKIFYEDENYVVEKKPLDSKNPSIADENFALDYAKYNQFVEEYKKKYTSNIVANLDVIMYVDDGNETRNVGSVQIPLGKENYQITRQVAVDEEHTYEYVVRDWKNTNTIYIVIGSFLVLLSLFLLFHLTKLALATTGKKSKYQEELMSILNEYDRLIVIARDGYESNIEKRVVKLQSFNELLDVRGVLNKPIIYSRVNNVKSEFIVEDDDVIYKFILKEADLENEGD